MFYPSVYISIVFVRLPLVICNGIVFCNSSFAHRAEVNWTINWWYSQTDTLRRLLSNQINGQIYTERWWSSSKDGCFYRKQSLESQHQYINSFEIVNSFYRSVASGWKYITLARASKPTPTMPSIRVNRCPRIFGFAKLGSGYIAGWDSLHVRSRMLS